MREPLGAPRWSAKAEPKRGGRAITAPDFAVDQPVLARLALEESHQWVEKLCATLAADGREIRGGWPGTLSEARSRATARLNLDNARSNAKSNAKSNGSRPVITPELLEGLVQALYLAAKKEWLTRAPRP